MKKLSLAVSCILICNLVLSQPKAKGYFLERSKKQKTTAWVLLATGTASIITGAILDASNRGTGNSQSYTGGLLEVGGFICTLTSVPFFISSAKNKKRATTLTINNRSIILPFNNLFGAKRQTSLSLNIPL